MKARNNRTKRRRRNRKFLARLAVKRFTHLILKANNGPNMDYYTLTVYPPKTEVCKGGRRCFVGSVKYVLRQNQKYRDLIAELIAKCGDMVVEFPPEFFEEAGR